MRCLDIQWPELLVLQTENPTVFAVVAIWRYLSISGIELHGKRFSATGNYRLDSACKIGPSARSQLNELQTLFCNPDGMAASNNRIEIFEQEWFAPALQGIVSESRGALFD